MAINDIFTRRKRFLNLFKQLKIYQREEGSKMTYKIKIMLNKNKNIH